MMRQTTLSLLVFLAVVQVGCATKRVDRDVSGNRYEDAGIPGYAHWGDRKVAWMQRGNLGGFPVFYAHGNPGSRLELLYLADKASQYGLRLIVMDRPGLGASDYVEDYDLLDFARDTERLADELGVEDFGLIGWSSGGPPVLATAYHLPERVRFAISVSSYTNFGEFAQARELMDDYGLRGPEMSREHPTLFNKMVGLVRWADLELPNFYLKMAEVEMPEADRQVLRDKNVAELFIRNQQEALEQGREGTIRDLEVQWAPWPFSMSDIDVPVYVFQGKADTFVPWEFSSHLARTIPDAHLTLYPDRGHLMPLTPEFQDTMFEVVLQYVD